MQIGTHNGQFHTDEVFAVALLLILFPDATIVRTRDPKVLETCRFVVDVGGEHQPLTGRFDHHQKGGAGEWPDGTRYSSFGLVWLSYGEQLLPSGSRGKTLEMLDEMLVKPIDARDNGQQPERRARDIPSIADLIADLNPAWNETVDQEQEDRLFHQAVEIAKAYLWRLIARVKAQQEAAASVRRAVWQARTILRDPRLITLEQGMPWQEVVINEAPQAQFVVMPGKPGSGEWLVQAIPVELGKQQPLRRRLPEAWGGLSGQALVEITGVSDAKFSHNNAFIAIAKSREGALTLAKLALGE